MSPLPGERETEIELRVRVDRTMPEHDTKRALGVEVGIALKMLPPLGERRVHVVQRAE
jgi:hypothetical protein